MRAPLCAHRPRTEQWQSEKRTSPPAPPQEPLGRVDVRELKEHTSEVVRRVREDHETVDITCRGEVVAQIIPVRRAKFDREAARARWAARMELGRQISERDPKPFSAVDAISEGRDERW